MTIGNITLTESWDLEEREDRGFCRTKRSRGCSIVVSVIHYPAKDSGLAGASAGKARNTRSFLYMCIYVNSEIAVFDL